MEEFLTSSIDARSCLTFWRRIFFSLSLSPPQILAHTVFKM